MNSARATACAHCNSPLAASQEWCHECGRARSPLFRPPDWRIGAAIVVGVVALAAAATVFALARVSNNADRSAAVALPAPAASQPASASSGVTTPPGRLLSWPAGLGGWTVILSSATNESQAKATAAGLAGAVSNLGVLDSSQHPSMSPGHWVVFSGRYPTAAEAKSAAAQLVAQGHSSARARIVEPPGGN